MISKLTYFDIKMYFFPGTWFIGNIIALLYILNVMDYAKFDYELFGSVFFIVISYVTGHIFQTHAHGRPERKLKKKHWNSMLPSQRMFFPRSNIINEEMRKQYLNHCLRNKLINKDDISDLNKGYRSKQLFAKISTAFQSTWIKHASGSSSNRIDAAESNFQFYRGMFVVAFWSAVLFAIPVLCYIGAHIVSMNMTIDIRLQEYSLLTILLINFGIILNLVIWKFFKWRCRGAAQGFAREVVRATIAK